MKIGDLVIIERKDNVTLYGRFLDHKGRLGQFEVSSDHLGNNGFVYPRIVDPQIRMATLIGVTRR